MTVIYVTVYEKIRHMGFFMKIVIALLVVLVISELPVVQILERSLASFFRYDVFFPITRKHLFRENTV